MKSGGAQEAAKVGAPIGLHFLVESGIFSLAGVLAARLSGPAVAAHQIALNWASLTFCVAAGIGSTDHLSFIAEGVPGFNPVQEYANYDVRIHHTNMDTMERMNPDDLKQSSVIFATLAYNAAMRDEKIPRDPARAVP